MMKLGPMLFQPKSIRKRISSEKDSEGIHSSTTAPKRFAKEESLQVEKFEENLETIPHESILIPHESILIPNSQSVPLGASTMHGVSHPSFFDSSRPSVRRAAAAACAGSRWNQTTTSLRAGHTAWLFGAIH